MIRALHIGNFKAFGATQRVPIKPITLIFGPNSAGKSSLIHSLALAHQAEKSGNLDVVRTDIGGRAIDLGGFRQYVHRRQASNRVTWGIDLSVSELPAELKAALGASTTVSLRLTIGMPLDDQDRPKPGVVPQIVSCEFGADDQMFMRMSSRAGGKLAVDRIEVAHPVTQTLFQHSLALITTSSVTDDDLKVLTSVIDELIPELLVQTGGLFPEWVIHAGRADKLEDAVYFSVLRAIRALVSGVATMARETLNRLTYLGPLRSYPARHLAFIEEVLRGTPNGLNSGLLLHN